MLGYVVRPLSGILAIAYGLSFLAICLGGCLAAAPADHGCCQDEAGLRAASSVKDCCAVVPALSGKCPVPAVLPASPVSTVWDVATSISAVHTTVPHPTAAGPPLILRI